MSPRPRSLVTLLLLTLSAPAAATTCIVSEPDFVTLPANGAKDVPTNAEVKIWGLTARETTDAWQLQDASGVLVPAELKRTARGPRRMLRLIPKVGLVADQEYQLVLRGKAVARFVTGAAPDPEPPAAPALTGAKLTGRFADPSSWNVQEQLADFTWHLEGTPSPGAAAYLLSFGADPVPQAVWSEAGLPQLFWGPCLGNFPDGVDPSAFDVSVTAVDLAGNASAPVKLSVKAPPEALPSTRPGWLIPACVAAVLAAPVLVLRRSRTV